MFHVLRTEKDLKYFIYTLLEQNDKLERVAFVGGDRDKASRLHNTVKTLHFPCMRGDKSIMLSPESSLTSALVISRVKY